MKKYLALIVIIFSALAMYSFTTFNANVDDIFKTLGIPAAHAKDLVWKSFVGKNLSLPANSSIKTYPLNKRVAAVYEIGAYVKSYLISPDFKNQYQQLREERRPVAPATMQQRINAEIAEFTRALKESEEACKRVSPELKSIYEVSIKKYKQYITSLENEYDPQHSELIEGISTRYGYDMGDYVFRVRQFEKEYPADVRAFIKLRLQEFLQLSSNVDFNARLVESSGKKRFVNQTYESRPAVWKYCFRAGKESTEAARSLAKQWLKEI
jgi:hypothetical protein